MVDVLVIGGGLAGWRAAEAAVKAGASVTLIANGTGNSPDIHAINVPVRADDSIELFIDDTLKSGGGACEPALVETLCRGSVNLLEEFPFDRNADGSYKTIQPLGCSVPRCISIDHKIGAWALARIKRELSGKVSVIQARVTKIIQSCSLFTIHLATTTLLLQQEASSSPRGDGAGNTISATIRRSCAATASRSRSRSERRCAIWTPSSTSRPSPSRPRACAAFP